MDNQPTPMAAPTGPAPANNMAELPPVPTDWPGGFGLYKYSKAAVRFNLSAILGVYIVNLVLNAITRLTHSMVVSSVALLVSSFLGLAIAVAAIAAVRRTKMSFEEALSQSVPLFLKYLGLYILLILIAFVTMLLFIIPFFIVFPRISLAPYFLIDQKLGITESIKASWGHTKGHVGKWWSVFAATLAMALLMITIIGIPFALYFLLMYSAAFPLLYFFIIGQNQATTSQTSQAPAVSPVETATPVVPAAVVAPQAPVQPEVPPVNPPAAQ